jgi:hypothetical protein
VTTRRLLALGLLALVSTACSGAHPKDSAGASCDRLSIRQAVGHGTGTSQSVTLDVATPSGPLASTLVEVDLLSADGATVFRMNQATDARGHLAFSPVQQLSQQPAALLAVQRAASVTVKQKPGPSCTVALDHRR